MKNIKRISVLYIFMILLIIALADQGHLHYLKQIVFLIPYGDKWGHFFLIGLLAFFVNLWLNCEKLKVFKWFFLKGSVIILIIITLEEFSQIFINRSHRHFRKKYTNHFIDSFIAMSLCYYVSFDSINCYWFYNLDTGPICSQELLNIISFLIIYYFSFYSDW